MGKKNKYKAQQTNQAPPQPPPAPVSPVAQKTEAPVSRPPEHPPAEAKPESLISSAKALFQSMLGGTSTEAEATTDAPADVSLSLQAQLEEALEKTRVVVAQCQQREEQARSAQRAAEEAQARLSKWEDELGLRDMTLAEREKGLTQREEQLSRQETTHKKAEGQLLQDKEALRRRELNAEAGFSQERRESLRLLEEEARTLHEQLSQQRERIASERAEWEKARAREHEELDGQLGRKRDEQDTRLEKEKNEHDDRLRGERAAHVEGLRGERAAHDKQLREERTEHDKQLREERTEHDDQLRQRRDTLETELENARRQLEQDRAELESEQRKLANEKKQLGWDREDLKTERQNLAERAKQLAAKREEALQHTVEDLKDRLETACAERNRLTTVLAGREELDRRFGHQPPEEVLKDLQTLREERDKLKQALASRPGMDAAEQLRSLLSAKEHLEVEQTRLFQENQSLKHELTRHRVAVVEIETIRDQKAALESSRELLHAAVEDLRKDVDERIRRSDGRSPFPSLSGMDTNAQLQTRPLVHEEIPDLKAFVEELQHRIAQDPEARKAGKTLYYPPEVLRTFLAGLAMSPLLLLQGISGTGKTSLPLAFARAIGAGSSVIEVQAGWRDKHDLIGHFNAFERRFYEGEFLQALYRARCPQFAELPFLIVLDEMNLSHPEQYFADLLSAMEQEARSQKLHLMTAPVEPSPSGLEQGRTLPLPRNVWFIGTANHDETTKEFADKTYDRAHVMEFLRAQPRPFPVKPHDPRPPLGLQALHTAFEQAKKKHEKEARKAYGFLHDELSELLKGSFRIGLSNRLERQLMAYVPVVISAGGSLGEALDHILATKLLRKIRNQHDTRGDDLIKLRDHLQEAWSKKVDPKEKPKGSLELIADQLKRLGVEDEDEAA